MDHFTIHPPSRQQFFDPPTLTIFYRVLRTDWLTDWQTNWPRYVLEKIDQNVLSLELGMKEQARKLQATLVRNYDLLSDGGEV